MQSRIDLAQRVDPRDGADAVATYVDQSTDHRRAFHAALAEMLAPGRDAVVRSSEVLEAVDLAPLELEGDEPAPYTVTVRVNADVEVQEDGERVVEEHREEDVPLQIVATLAPSGVGDDVELLVHEVAEPPAGLAG